MFEDFGSNDSVISSPALRFAVWAGVLGATALGLALWWNGDFEFISMEHGPIEMLHLVLTAATAIVCTDAYRRGQGAMKVAAGSLAMLAAAIVVRELDVKSIPGPDAWRWFTHHGLQEALFLAMLAPIFVYLFRQRAYFGDIVQLVFSWRAWPLFAAGGFLVLSIALEKSFVRDDHARFWEELSETYGFGFLLMAGLRHRMLIAGSAIVAGIEGQGASQLQPDNGTTGSRTMDPTAIALKAILAIGSVYVCLLVGAYVLQARLLYYPDSVRTLPDALGLAGVTERIIYAPDGARIISWWGAGNPGRPTILYFHGNAGSLVTRSERMRKYMARGYGVVMMTYRGFGGSTGKPSEKANVADAKQLYDAVVASGVDPRALVLYGESLGTGVVIQVAVEKPVAGIVLDAPYTSMVEIAGLHYPYLPARWLMTDRYDSARRMPKIKCPVLIVQGEDDGIVPVAMGQKMASLATGPVEIRTFVGAGHADHHLFGSYDVIYDWLARLEAGIEKGALPSDTAPSEVR